MDTTMPTRAAFAVRDDSFLDLVGPAARLDLVIETDAHEGPVYVAGEDALYFTTVPRDRAGPGRASTSGAWRSTARGSRPTTRTA